MSQWTFSVEPHWPEFVEVKGGFLPPSIAHVIIHHPLLELYSSRSSTCFNGIHHGAINFNGEQILRKWPAALNSKLPSDRCRSSLLTSIGWGVMFTPDAWTSRARSLDKLSTPPLTLLWPLRIIRESNIFYHTVYSPILVQKKSSVVWKCQINVGQKFNL